MKTQRLFLLVVSLTLLIIVSLVASSEHPPIPIMDMNEDFANYSGEPLSTNMTCGMCHDVETISTSCSHSDIGFHQFIDGDTLDLIRDWDKSTGYWARWNPVLYGVKFDETPTDEQMREWIKTAGVFHAGGGPSELNAEGILFSEIDEKGGVELNCLLCHWDTPNYSERKLALEHNKFKWANTASLVGSGLVSKEDDNYVWNADGFDDDGYVKPEYLKIIKTQDKHCGYCHGLVHSDTESQLNGAEKEYNSIVTLKTGQIFSSQRISQSGLNFKEGLDLSRPWDMHSQRGITCVMCHSAPIDSSYITPDSLRKAHLIYDPRGIDLIEDASMPAHNFAHEGLMDGQSGFTTQNCESCHDFSPEHDWLPYKARHMQSLSCESCHIPQLMAPAYQTVDWTIVDKNGNPRIEYRGTKVDTASGEEIVTGYTPVFLQRTTSSDTKLYPYNLITSYYWLSGDPAQPVSKNTLIKAYFDGEKYKDNILSEFDSDQNGYLESGELLLDSQSKIDVVKSNLEGLGETNISISGDIQPIGVHHNVTRDQWIVRDCQACHTTSSHLAEKMVLANNAPLNVTPAFVNDPEVYVHGDIEALDGSLVFQSEPLSVGFYILGHEHIWWANVVGSISVILVLIGVLIHGGLRIVFREKFTHRHEPVKKIYIYDSYRRFWHWLQATAIVILIFTGLVIHAPELYRFMSFSLSVWLHNASGFILFANALLAMVYHFASGKIRSYIPKPQGFFTEAIEQAMFYLKGIFTGEKHPFEKDADEKRLNPLQKITYLIILNFLLPLQVITGILIWGAQYVPNFLKGIGGLTLLVPAHSLMAWFFAAFLILHIYLTTTGHTPLANIKAMINGWEDVPIDTADSH